MVRDAVSSDVPAIRAVALRVWPAAYEGLFEPEFIERVLETAYSLETLERQVADPASVFLVAEEDGAVAGYLHYADDELHRLYIDPDRQGAGVGATLLDELNRRLPSGHEYVALVREGNERALRFYERRGFARAGLVDGFAMFAEREGIDPARLGRRGRDVLVRYVVP